MRKHSLQSLKHEEKIQRNKFTHILPPSSSSVIAGSTYFPFSIKMIFHHPNPSQLLLHLHSFPLDGPTRTTLRHDAGAGLPAYLNSPEGPICTAAAKAEPHFPPLTLTCAPLSNRGLTSSLFPVRAAACIAVLMTRLPRSRPRQFSGLRIGI